MTPHKRRLDMARAQAELRQRERERGLVRVLVTIPQRRRPQLEEIVGEWLLEDLVPPHVAKP